MTSDALFQKRIIFVTGKGGVGKSLYAAALAAHAASLGKKVCLVEATAEEQAAPLFGHAPVGHKVTEVAPNLSLFNIDAQLNFRDFLILHLGFEGLFDRVFNNDIVRSFIRMIPGIAELTFLGRLYYLTNLAPTNRMDLVIVDGFASGHFLSLMTTPDAILSSGLTGPVVAETKKVRDFLAVPENAGMVLVTQPGLLIQTETEEFVQRFVRESPVSLQRIVLNRSTGLGHTGDSAPHDLELASPAMRALWERQRKSSQDSWDHLHTLVNSLGPKTAELVAMADWGAFTAPPKAAGLVEWLDKGLAIFEAGKRA